MIRVLLAEDHHLVREGIRALIDSFDGIEVIAAVDNGRRALTGVGDHAPDVVIVDLSMPDMNGIEAISRLRKDDPDIGILVLSMHRDHEFVARALREGASGYLLKEAVTAELELAIRAAARGEAYLTPAISRTVIQEYVDAAPRAADPFELLTPRQREVLQLVAEGLSSREIAEKLFLSVKTIETHRGALMDRLDIHDVPGLVRYAIRAGLTSV